MKFFIDESLSPLLATRLSKMGDWDAIHPLHFGRRGESDRRVLARCLDEDRIIVTQNARDFRALIGRTDLHPGLITLPSVARETTWALLVDAIKFLEGIGDPSAVMVNHVLEIEVSGQIALAELPKRR